MKSSLDVKLTCWTAFCFFAALFFANAQSSAIEAKLPSLASYAITLTVISRFVFMKWAWKWPVLQFLEKLHKTPVLEGSWQGKIHSNGNQRVQPTVVDVTFEIIQSDIHTLVVKRASSTSNSRSFAETVLADSDGTFELAYSYLSQPIATSQQQSPISFGTAKLRYLPTPEPRLEGNYWTDQGTTGTIAIERA